MSIKVGDVFKYERRFTEEEVLNLQILQGIKVGIIWNMMKMDV